MLSNCGVWKVELWVAWLDPAAALLVSHNNLSTIYLGYLTLHTTGPRSLFTEVDYLSPGLDYRITLLVIAKDKIYAREHSSGKSACITPNTAYLLLVSLHSADCRSYRSTSLSKQCFNAYCRPSGRSP